MFTPINSAAKQLIKRREIKKQQLLKDFSTEPIDELADKLRASEIKMTAHEALKYDLTNFLQMDMLYRFENAGDIAINIQGHANKGKSNCLLHLGMQWCGITEQPYQLSNIVYNGPEFNLLLKGYKVKQLPGDATRITVEEFDPVPGLHMSLDEAGDAMTAGMLSRTTIMQTADLEARMRALQIGRFCAGVREILHQAYYSIQALHRNPHERICTGLVYVRERNQNDQMRMMYLGSVRIPYVDSALFKAYNAPKLKSIRDYSRGVGTNRIAQLINYFAEELRVNPEFQALPVNPNSERLNWLQRNPKYSIWGTTKYFDELERMTRPPKEEKLLKP